MSTIREQLQLELDRLEQMRDELRVQAHLAKGELKDQWERAEDRFLDLQNRAKLVQSASDDSVQQMSSTIHKLADELREGYRRIKTLLS